jgi:hypothetical protein
MSAIKANALRHDLLVAFLAGAAAIPGVSLLLTRDYWVLGRTNCHVYGMVGLKLWELVGCLFGAVWFFYRIIREWPSASRTRRAWHILLAALILLPWVLPGPSVFLGGFMEGFSLWVKANVDCEKISEWSDGARMGSSPEAPVPEYWPAKPTSPTILVPQARWPDAIARVKPDQVRVLTDNSAVMLCWGQGGAWSWIRLVVVTGDDKPAPVWAPPPGYGVASAKVEDGVWIYVRSPS